MPSRQSAVLRDNQRRWATGLERAARGSALVEQGRTGSGTFARRQADRERGEAHREMLFEIGFGNAAIA
jgi:hypothetical protein